MSFFQPDGIDVAVAVLSEKERYCAGSLPYIGIISERCSTGLHSTNKHGPSGQKK